MIKRVLIIVFSLFLILDLGYSFLQHYNAPLDGDMSGGIVPAEEVRTILENPLGIEAFRSKESYPNPNRFVCHWTYYHYFNAVPYIFQSFTTPLNSVYIACALAKTIIQLGLILVLSLFVTGKLFNYRFVLAAVLITPLFQTNGYQNYMGIIDPSTTYTFFYALPTVLILVYFLPLFFKEFYGRTFRFMKYFKYLWIPFALIISLSGPLNPGVSLIIAFLFFLNILRKEFRNKTPNGLGKRLKNVVSNTPSEYYFYLIPLSLFSVYSLFLGSYSSSELSNHQPLSYLYSRLPDGIYYILTRKLGFILLLLTIGINFLLIKKRFSSIEGKRLLSFTKWVLLFAVIYILLLPLGGYREYRPNVLRYDTFLPITIGLLLVFAKTTLYLLDKFRVQQIRIYPFFTVLVLLIFTIADKPEFDKNQCERDAITQLADSDKEVVLLKNDCTVLSWSNIHEPEVSKEKCELLKKWNILEKRKLFYQKQE